MKRRGRPRKGTATQTVAERVAKHRARKRAEIDAAIENDPQRLIAYLKTALEAAHATIAAASEQQRLMSASIAELRERVVELEHERDSLRSERVLLRKAVEQLRDLMSKKLSPDAVDEFFGLFWEVLADAMASVPTAHS